MFTVAAILFVHLFILHITRCDAMCPMSYDAMCVCHTDHVFHDVLDASMCAMMSQVWPDVPWCARCTMMYYDVHDVPWCAGRASLAVLTSCAMLAMMIYLLRCAMLPSFATLLGYPVSWCTYSRCGSYGGVTCQHAKTYFFPYDTSCFSMSVSRHIPGVPRCTLYVPWYADSVMSVQCV
jgi:hypothetical protein